MTSDLHGMSVPVILAEREESSMVSNWNEYCCLLRLPENRLRLFTGRYEGLADIHQYYNEETENYDLPDEIDGKQVVGREDEIVVGGELQSYDDEVEFVDPSAIEVRSWLDAKRWSTVVSIEMIRNVARTI